MEKTVVLISGDSWGVGAYNCHGVDIHGGLAQFFTEYGYNVINSSRGGISNKESIKRLEKNILEYKNIDKIVFWIQTDPVRDVLDHPKKPDPNLTKAIKDAGGLFNLVDSLLLQQYQRLDQIANEQDIIVHVIGGLTNINLRLIKDFKNLNPLVQSWNHLLVGHIDKYSDWETHTFLGVATWNYYHIDWDSYEYIFRQKVLDEVHSIQERWPMFQELKDIYPDGAHPNASGNKILFDTIIKKLCL